MSKKRVIVFAPHPDDETWGCGGTIAKKINEGYEVLIVVMTDGRHSFSRGLGIESDPTPEELKEIRKEEVKRATRILGVPEENLLFLDFEDGMLEKNEREAQEEVIEILRENHPVEVYFPYEKDDHTDHRATNRIVRKSIKELDLRTMQYQYSIVRTYDRIGPLVDAFYNLFRRNIIHADVSKFLSLKKAASKEFQSKISIISSRQERPLVKNLGKFLTKEEKMFVHKCTGKLLKIGIIGLGKMGMLHFMNSVRFDNVKITAVADASKSRLCKAEKLGVKNLYSDFHGLLDENADLDAVIISLPNFLHLESVKLALENGINVFVEKPLARTTEECKQILHSVKKSGRKLMVGHCLRFIDVVERMKTIVEKGQIGNLEIITLESIASGPFSHGIIPKPVPEWWFDVAKVGGGALLDIGYHLIDLFRFFAGDCHLLDAHLGYKYNLSLEDSAIVVIQSHNSPVKGIVHAGWYEQVIFPKHDFRVILHGDYDHISSERFMPTSIYWYAAKEGIKNLLRKVTRRKIKPLAYAYALEGFNKELAHFFSCIENDLEPSVSAIDGLKTIEVIEEAYKLTNNSAKSGQYG